MSTAVPMIAAASSARDTSWVSATASPPSAWISAATAFAGSADPPVPSHSTPVSLTTTRAPR